ncbi:TIGR03621 family F420-dependent LLM class oxidoreductase [Nocardia huaxiensis]|uniref:TIGR03621 family F420-dependent LLM class oxidoreductase n=1 Tax=Nocardia huaxiensis TaxID=2755382 RepID=UPI001E2C3744|nr:TIGR03621 family F420-dependent LLM class oxidoreductase [Nocardia huaxiensis]UFS98331.1 TIGR03621 family F420-dependent LLM class oxidoreductase [Nocardia huaxiensis]
MVLPFRFGVNLLAPVSRAEWIKKCRRAEELGYDVIGVADHLGMPAPFPALMLAADVTTRPRLNTFVLNTPFYNPVLLARDVAGLDQLTDGRIELGLGAGYVQAEFEAAGMPFPSPGERVAHLEHAVHTLRGLFADPEYQPRPAQPEGPPLLIAAWGERALRLAAEHADIVAFTGGGAGPDGRIILADDTVTAKKTAYLRDALGDRAGKVEFNLLIQGLAAPEERDAALGHITDNLPMGFSGRPEDLTVLLFGTPEQQADALRRRREVFGFNYVTVLEHNMEKFAPLIALLQGE